jgi:hypothetical protein
MAISLSQAEKNFKINRIIPGSPQERKTPG